MVILASQALSVEQTRDWSLCPGAKTLNFSQESIEDWRSPTRLEGWYGDTLSFWNNTTPDVTDPNFFDYWDQPNESIKHLANAVLIRDGPMPDSSQKTCGEGWDCEFNITFVAPGYRCEHIPTGSSQRFKTPRGAVPPFNESVLIPRGDFSYYSHASRGEYLAVQMDSSGSGGVITTKPPFPKDLGTFRTEPIIWVGYSTIVGSGEVPRNRTMPGWDGFFVPKMLYCEMFETEYTVEFKYVQQAQASRVLERKYIAPIINTTYDPTTITLDGTRDPITAYPKDRYVYPHDTARYRYVAAYHSVGAAFRDIVNGTIDSKQIDQPMYGETKVWMTRMADLRKDCFPVPNLMEALQGLFEDILVSMINRPDLFLVVSWAANATRISGGREGDESTMYPCIRSRPENRFRYNSMELGAVYGVSIMLATVAVSIGTFAVIRNGGILRNTRFSSIATLLQHCGYSLDIYSQLHPLEDASSR